MHNSIDKGSESTARKDELQRALEKVRQQSIEAARRGDYRTVAKLTLETARLNAEFNNASNSTAKASSLLALLS